MRGRQPPVRYKVAVPIHAVKLEARPGSSLPDPTGTLVEIPIDAIDRGGGAGRPLWPRQCSLERSSVLRLSTKTFRKKLTS